MSNTPRQAHRLLAALDVLLEERNVTRAARRLHLSQPAVSGALSQLRELFGDPLLVRVGRDLVLTPRAAELMPLARDALASVDRLFGGPGVFDPQRLRRQFRIAVSDAAGQLLLPAVMRRLLVEAPEVTLRVSSAPHEVPTPLLGSGALDLAVAHYEDIPPDLRASMLYENRLVAVARARHPMLRGRLTMRQFVSLPQVVVFPHSTSTEDELRRAFGAAGAPFRLVASVQPLGAAVAMVAATDAIALVSEPVARFHAKALPLQVLELPRGLRLPKVPVRAVWHERSQHDAGCAWLRKLLREEGSRNGAGRAAARPAGDSVEFAG